MKRRWSTILWWIVTSSALLALLMVALRPQPVPVDIAPVVRGRFEQTVEEDGKTRVRERYTVSAPLEGRLERIRLKAGDPVERDMVLAVMHPKESTLLDARTEHELVERVNAAEALQRQARATVERAQASLQQAQSDYDRIKTLATDGLATQAQREHAELTMRLAAKDLAAAEFGHAAAAHQVDMARAAVSRVQHTTRAPKNDHHWEIRSPVLGRVLRVLHENEGVVALGAPLLEIADSTELEVIVDVLTTDAVLIQVGAWVWLERWGGTSPLEGRVRLVEPAGFTKISALGVEEQRVNVVIDITSPQQQWLSVGDGYRVDARIVVFQQDNVITVPTGALFREGDQWGVFVVANGRAHKRRVLIDKRNGFEALVKNGLEPEEQVVIYPSDAIHDGVRVVVRPKDRLS